MKVCCATCGSPFEKRPLLVARSAKHYCSVACRKTGLIKPCKYCESPFYVPACRTANGFGDYCSPRCARSATRIERTCQQCGGQFHRLGGGLYCSRMCSAASRVKTSPEPCEWCGESTRNFRFCSVSCHDNYQSRNRLAYRCKTCGAAFQWSPSRVKIHNPTYCSMPCRTACPDWKTNAVIAGNLKQQQSKEPTRLEQAGAAILRRSGIAFDEQVLIAGKFVVDALLRNTKIVVQWDGAYWHGYRANGDSRPLDARQKKRSALDRSQDAYMRASGFVVLRFWDHEVFNSQERVIEAIQIAIQQIAA